MRRGAGVGVAVALGVALWAALSSGSGEPDPAPPTTTTTAETSPMRRWALATDQDSVAGGYSVRTPEDLDRGSRVIRLERTAPLPGEAALVDTVVAGDRSGDEAELTAWVRADPGVAVELWIEARGGRRLDEPLAAATSGAEPPGTAWTRRSVRLRVPEGTEQLRVGVGARFPGPGDVWIDDVRGP